ncbi:MAG: hypothetical protein HDT38_01120 [Clostridiales bacterium]|nr:hypothetical protein [Clostridiales bacterium]
MSGLTQIQTQNRKRAGGHSGDNRAGKHPTPEQTDSESAKKPPPALLTAAHNPKVVGSNPAPATNHRNLFFDLFKKQVSSFSWGNI